MEEIVESNRRIKDYIKPTLLQLNERLSQRYNCEIYLKREDSQNVRSFKVRGAANKILKLPHQETKNGIVCVSQGNHSQGVAYVCNKLKIDCFVFMPETTPKQKIDRVKSFNANVFIDGSTFKACLDKGTKYANDHNMTFVHPYDDNDVIHGQGTIALEIFEELTPDIIISPIGGGGLMSGISIYSKSKNKDTVLIGVEPEGCASLANSFKKKKILYWKIMIIL